MVKGYMSRDNMVTIILGLALTITFCMAMYIPIASFRRENSTHDHMPVYHDETYTYTSDSTLNTYN